MKKYYVLFAFLATLTSCETMDCEKVEMKTSSGHNRTFHVYVQEFGYNGHDYIWFSKNFSAKAASGVVHSPDCHCRSKEVE